jgi:hypothetical protein
MDDIWGTELTPDQIVRLEIVKAYLPQAARADLQNPDVLVANCSKLEEYVLNSKKMTG